MFAKEGRQRFRNPEGRFQYCDAQPGRFWLFASAADYGGGRSRELIITPGIGVEGLEIRMVRGAALTGRVVDAGGTSIAGAVVTVDVPRPTPRQFGGLWRVIEYERPETTTTDGGTYSFPHLLGGTYVVMVKHPERAPYASEPFKVAASGDQTMPDIILARGAAIRGRVKLRDGSPDAKAMVQIAPVGASPNFSGHRSAYTDADGRFEVNGLALGQYRVVVVQRNGKPDLEAIFTTLKNPQRLHPLRGRGEGDGSVRPSQSARVCSARAERRPPGLQEY